MSKQNVFISGMFAPVRASAYCWVEAHFPDAEIVELGVLVEADLEMGFAYADNDVCISALGAIGQLLRAVITDSIVDDVVFVVPELCVDCSGLDLRHMLESAAVSAGILGSRIYIVDATTMSQWASQEPPDSALASRCDEVAIGLTGTTAMLSNEFFYESVVGYIADRGCRVVVAPVSITSGLTDYLANSLRYFREQGLETVICLLPFGCLSGFVHTRGVLNEVKKRFPGISVYFLEIDPNASELNMRNRLELVVESASCVQRRQAERKG